MTVDKIVCLIVGICVGFFLGLYIFAWIAIKEKK